MKKIKLIQREKKKWFQKSDECRSSANLNLKINYLQYKKYRYRPTEIQVLKLNYSIKISYLILDESKQNKDAINIII